MLFLGKDEEYLNISLHCVFQLETPMPNEMPRDLISAKNLNKIRDYNCI